MLKNKYIILIGFDVNFGVVINAFKISSQTCQ